jgi:hypothetical protein
MKQLLGTTTKIFNAFDENKPISSVFFKPYDSGLDFFYRVAAIITVPIISTALSLYVALDTVFQIFRAITFLIKDRPEVVKDATNRLKEDIKSLLIGILLIPLSPIIEAVDVIGSGIASLSQNIDADESEVQNSL